MTDDSRLFAARHKAPKRMPKPGELLFDFHVERTHTFWRVELRDHGAYGVEAQFFDPVDLRFAQTFRNPVRDGDRIISPRELAISWEAERAEMLGPAR